MRLGACGLSSFGRHSGDVGENPGDPTESSIEVDRRCRLRIGEPCCWVRLDRSVFGVVLSVALLFDDWMMLPLSEEAFISLCLDSPLAGPGLLRPLSIGIKLPME